MACESAASTAVQITSGTPVIEPLMFSISTAPPAARYTRQLARSEFVHKECLITTRIWWPILARWETSRMLSSSDWFLRPNSTAMKRRFCRCLCWSTRRHLHALRAVSSAQKQQFEK